MDKNYFNVVLVSQSRFNSRGIKNPIKTPYSKHRWDRIIIDEAHVIKNKTSKIHIAISCLRSSIRWALTATPIMNKMTDFVNILKFIGIPQIICQNHKEYVSKMYILRRTKQDVQEISLPTLNINVCQVPFKCVEEFELYKQVYEEVRVSLQKMKKNNNNNAIQAFELLLRMRQVCCNPQCYFNGISKKTGETLHIWKFQSSKLLFIIDSIKQQPVSDKTLIFCHFKHEIKSYTESLLEIGRKSIYLDGSCSIDEREQLLKSFNNDPSISVFIIQIQTGGVGLNLQNANWLYITSPLWSPSYQSQVIGRAHRTGQTKPVNVFILSMTHENKDIPSIEEYILSLQKSKRTIISEVLNDDRILNENEQTSFIKDKINFYDVYKMFTKKI